MLLKVTMWTITDPDQSQKFENWWAVTRTTAIKGALSFGLFLIPPFGQTIAGYISIGKLLLSGLTFAGISLFLKTYRSDADNEYTEEVDEPAKARINYLEAPYVNFANEGGILELGFNRGSSCQIEVTATAKFSRQSAQTGVITELHTLEESILVTVSL